MDVGMVAEKAATPLTTYLLAGFAGFLAAVGDSFLNVWAKTLPETVIFMGMQKSVFMMGGLVFWNSSLVIFILMLQRGFLAQSVVLFIVSNCVFALLMSQIWFGEKLTMVQWFAIVLAVGAVVLMEMGGAKSVV